jgi:hypothetical protein
MNSPSPLPSGKPQFEVPTWMHLLSGWVHRRPDTWIRLGNLETRLVGDALIGIDIDRPVYIAGLARAGTTVLLEQLARHPDVTTHRYIDYPPVLTPYWWNRWLALVPQARGEAQGEARERAHRDGIAVTAQSPEAFEEMVWMAFFPHLHDPQRESTFHAATAHPEFERFYRDHIRKLLAVRGGRRYVAKGNYNLTRLPYLLRLFPDARFVVAVRDPVWHIASLMKQHALFCQGERETPRALDHMRRAGHYEFGLDRRPVNVGNQAETERIIACWESSAEVEGWARYWAALYGYLADLLERDSAVAGATLVVRYEALCGQPVATLQKVLAHAALPLPTAAVATAAAGLRAPTYYSPAFDSDELALIGELTGAVAGRFGYPAGPG